MNRKLASRVVLITGGTRGIGRAIADLFAAQGARLALCARTREDVGATVTQIREAGGTAVGYVADIGDPEQAENFVRFTHQQYGSLDVVINNAGILGPRTPISEYSRSDWTSVLQVNLTGTFYVCQTAARLMMDQAHGTIIMISSSVGRRARARWGAYAVSKFGIEGLSQVLAEELHPYGITVFSANPGGARTSMRAEAYPNEDPASIQSPSMVAEALLRVLADPPGRLSGHAVNLSDFA